MDLVDKERFRELAARLDPPVPASRRVVPAEADDPRELDLPFPLLLKPLLRRFNRLAPLVDGGKALSCVTAHHACVSPTGELVAVFTGSKLRTRPAADGFSTALEPTAAEDVAELGRALVARLELVGIAKLDFERASVGELRLLEANPRFNLWHHLAAAAGPNLPALVHAGLTGRPRPPVPPVRR